MKQLPADWSRCRPAKCKHRKEHCARFTSPIGKHTPVMDLSAISKGDKCAGYEWNGGK